MIDYEAVRKTLTNKSDEQLFDILKNNQADYNPSVIPIVEQILIERGIALNDIETAKATYEKQIKSDRPKVKEKPGFWDRAAKSLIIGIILYVLGYLTVELTNSRSNPAAPERPWSKTYEKAAYDTIYKSADTLFQDAESKKKFTSCIIEKLKTTYPNGLADIQKDSLRNIYYKIGQTCAKESSTTVFKRWTPEFEKILINSLMQNKSLKTVNEKVKRKFCECYIIQLKSTYPNGIAGKIPGDVQKQAAITCADQIKLNK
ncbi:MAG: hypothetical protein V4456_11655 [Bacteroidota bacterium]